MNKLTDLEINCAVRKVLVRHWIDLGKISIRSTSGVVTLSGTLDKLPKVDSPLTSSSVGEIVSEIRRASSVKRVQSGLTNWGEADGMWKPIATKSAGISQGISKVSSFAPHDLSEEWIEVNEKKA
jgi:hypothetical protein